MVFTEKDLIPYRENIEILRKMFKDEVQKNPDLYNPQDVVQLDFDCITICRVLIAKKNNVKDAFAYGIRTLKWRKKSNVYDIKKETLPPEYFTYNPILMYFGDKDNNLLVVFNLKDHHNKFGDSEKIRKFFMYFGERIFLLDRWLQATLILNLQGASIRQVEMNLVTEFLDVFRTYYCQVFAHLLVLGMSWVYESLYKIIKPLMPEEFRDKLLFVHNLETLQKYVDLSQVGEELGGTRKFDPPPILANFDIYVEKAIKDRLNQANEKQ